MHTFTDTGALDSRLGAPAKAFVGRRNRLLIDGKLVDAASGKTFPDYNPATGTILTQVAEADAVVHAPARLGSNIKISRIQNSAPAMRPDRRIGLSLTVSAI